MSENQENVLDWLNDSLKAHENTIKVNLEVIESIDDIAVTGKSIYSKSSSNIKLTLETNILFLSLVCSKLLQGTALLLDISWSGNELVKELAAVMNVPYIQLDVSISPWLLLLDKYLQVRNASDVVLIFDSPQSKLLVFELMSCYIKFTCGLLLKMWTKRSIIGLTQRYFAW